VVSVILAKEKLFRLYSKFALPSFSGSKSLGITDGLIKMPGIFSKMDFPVHPISDFLVVDLLLDVEFG
jgi:hypothetical protein